MVDTRRTSYFKLKAETLAFSRDGTKIAYTDLEEHWLWRIDAPFTAKPTRLTKDALGCALPSWSPDGRFLAFSGFNQATKQWNIYTLDTTVAGGGEPRALYPEKLAQVDATWSPDGRWIAYGRNPRLADASNLEP